MRIPSSIGPFLAVVALAAVVGCSTHPTIVGTWNVRPSSTTGGVESIEVFDNGTIVRHEGAKGDFADRYDLVINRGEDELVVTTLTRSVMVWSQPGGGEAFVFERVRP